MDWEAELLRKMAIAPTYDDMVEVVLATIHS